jgi:SnoaL-like domain
MTVPDVRQTVQTYVDAWNEPDGEKRLRLLERSWADDGTYTDPSVHLAGREALLDHARKFAERWPGAEIALTSGIDQHHATIRFTWRVAGADGQTLREGCDFGELGPDGRLQRIVGFFGPVPAPG